MIQSVRFLRTKYNNISALDWLAKHKMQPLKQVDVGANWLRYRISPPNATGTYKSLHITPEIYIVYLS